MKNRQSSVKKTSRSIDTPPSPSEAAAAAGNSSATSIVDSALSRQELSAMIATEAYFRAEKRGFTPGFELDDWLAAERTVAGSLRENCSDRNG